MQERIFPIGVQTFEDIRTDNAIYVDKTAYLYRMVSRGKYYFLARPRRFGKSLFLSTLKAYFEGRRELFVGLAIDKLETEWRSYPVLRFDFSRGRVLGTQSLAELMDSLLSSYEKEYGVSEGISKNNYGLRLSALIRNVKEHTGKRVVLLIDEYDAPLLDSMHNKSLFQEVRQQLRNFYSPIKEADPDLRFVFMTGITRYSQLSFFSELNSLMTISLHDDYAAVCGFTKDEVREQLDSEVERFAASQKISKTTALNRLKRYYDGYHFSQNSPDIYNPLDLLLCLSEKKLSNYWYATGTPTHLTEMLSKYTLRPEELDGFWASEMEFNVPIEQADTPIALLYQSGYLTIKKFDGYDYILGFPNEEVRVSFIKGLTPYYINKTITESNSIIQRLLRAFRQHEIDAAMTLLRAFYSSIPYDAEKQDENHYKTIFYLIFTLATEYCVRTEERSAAGRCDALIETEDTLYLFEFKLDGAAEEALKQINSKGYAIPYEAGDKRIVKIGVNFDADRRTIERWVVEM